MLRRAVYCMCLALFSPTPLVSLFVVYQFQICLSEIPHDEELLFWVKASEAGFGGYYSYVTTNLSLSCVPFSFFCLCLNVFNMPCLHSEYTENSRRIILATEYSLIVVTLSSSNMIEKTESCNWKRVKYIGSTTHYEERKKDSIRNPLSCSKSSDILIYTQKANEKFFRGISMDYVPDRDNCLETLRNIQKKYVPKVVRGRNSVLSASSYDSSMHDNQCRSVSFSDEPPK